MIKHEYDDISDARTRCGDKLVAAECGNVTGLMDSFSGIPIGKAISLASLIFEVRLRQIGVGVRPCFSKFFAQGLRLGGFFLATQSFRESP